MKVFISQPMKDKTFDEIEIERNSMIHVIGCVYPDEEIEVIDSLFSDEDVERLGGDETVGALWFLGEAIKAMDKADIVIMGFNWQHARGCQIEHEIAIDYDKKVLPYWTIERQYREMMEANKKEQERCENCKCDSEESENSSCNPSKEA